MIRDLCRWAVLSLAAAPPCMAADGRPEVERSVSGPMPEPVSDDDLALQRGGFRIGTLDVSLGAEIRSYLDGALVMQTNLSWADTGVAVQRAVLAGSSSDASGDGSTLRLDGGRTLFVQRADTAIQNVIVNTASNVALRQQIDARIDIAGYSPFRDGILALRLGSALARTIASASATGRSN